MLLVATETGGRLMRPRIEQEHGLFIRSPDGEPPAVRAVGQGPALGREQSSPDPMSKMRR